MENPHHLTLDRFVHAHSAVDHQFVDRHVYVPYHWDITVTSPFVVPANHRRYRLSGERQIIVE